MQKIEFLGLVVNESPPARRQVPVPSVDSRGPKLKCNNCVCMSGTTRPYIGMHIFDATCSISSIAQVGVVPIHASYDQDNHDLALGVVITLLVAGP